MNMQPEILGAIIGILGTAIIAFLGFYFSTHRGNKVVLRKIKETSLLKLSDFTLSNLLITFKDKPVNSIKLYELELSNEGYIDIDKFEFLLEIQTKEKTNFLEVQVKDNLWKTNLSDVSNGEYYFSITRPFLNMIRKNKEERIYFQVFTDTELIFDVVGGGKGWSVDYKEKNVDIPNLLKFYVILFMVMVFSLGLFTLISPDYVVKININQLFFGFIVLIILFTIDYFRKKKP